MERQERLEYGQKFFVIGPEAARHGAHTIGIRPEHLEIVAEGGWQGRVHLAEHLGSDTFLKVDNPELGELTVRVSGERGLNPGDELRLIPRPERIYRFSEDGRSMT